MRPIFILLFFILSLPAISQDKFSFEERKIDSTTKQLDSILILGVGSTASRIFLDKLSATLIYDLKHKKNVTAQYSYLGKTNELIKEELKKDDTKKYSGILLFIPADTSYFTTTTISGQYVSLTRMDYSQDFTIQLYLAEDVVKPAWTSYISVNCDLRKSYIQSKISKKILEILKENKHIK